MAGPTNEPQDRRQADADFVRRFADAWARPGPDPARFLDLFQAEIVLRAPLMPTTHGPEQAAATFGRLLRFIPDLRADVHGWGPDSAGLFINLTLRGTLPGGKEISWSAVDRFRLRDGLAVERVSFFDPMPILAAVMARPWTWPAALRSGMRPRRPRPEPDE